MLDSQLIFIEFSSCATGETLKRWVIVSDDSQIPSDQDEWNFTRNAWGKIKFILKRMSHSEMMTLNLANLERGIEFVKTGICSRFIIFD